MARKKIRRRRTKRKGKGLSFIKPKVIYIKNKQIGKSKLSRDSKRKALPPGKRISKYGTVYYEYRKNRSDKKGKRI